MSRVPASKACRLAVVAALLAAAGARAGDPVPDVDVILEQIPGGVITEVSSNFAGVDSIELDLGKDFAGDLSPARLPEGWSFEVVGSKVRLSGPPLDRPTRFKLDAGSAKRPEKISYQASQEGRKVLEQKNVKVTPVAPRAVIGSLQGIVEMPSEVAPGEPMQMTVLDPSALPPGGTWSLSGTVVDKEEEEDSEAATPEEPKRRLALAVAAGDDVPDEALDGIAATLATMGAPEESWEVVPIAEGDPLLESPAAQFWTVGSAPGAPSTQSVVMKATHDTAKQTIRNIRAEIASAPQPGTGSGLYSVWPSGVGAATADDIIILTPLTVKLASAAPQDSATIEQESVNEVAPAPPQDGITIDREEVNMVAGGGRVVSFALGGPPPSGDPPMAIVNKTRSNIKTVRQVAEALPGPDGKVVFDRLPADLQPGGAVSMQYVDRFGDVVADVPSVEGLQVVEPRGDGEARITDATPRSFAGQRVCVCGTYPGPAAWDGLLLDGQSVGSPASASGQIAWVELPAGLAPGEHVFTGTAAAGFPAADRASTVVLQVGGEIDSSKLQRLETTPVRLWVMGTEEVVDLRVRNLTPAIISIEGGDDQTIRTSGGAPNMLERTVRGLTPGAFDINYELAGEPCPCERQTHYY